MASFLDYFFVRTKHICPWWLCWIFDNRIHVSLVNYQESIEIAKKTGFKTLENPHILLSRACLMVKNP